MAMPHLWYSRSESPDLNVQGIAAIDGNTSTFDSPESNTGAARPVQ